MSVETKVGELVRSDGSFRILPVELEVRKLHAWTVQLMREPPQNTVWNYWFQLNLPDQPKGSVPWSDWIEPVERPGYSTADGITIRYRWTVR